MARQVVLGPAAPPPVADFGATRTVGTRAVGDVGALVWVAEQGITPAFGTDIIALQWPGDAVKIEMEMLVKSGLRPMQVLAMATSNAAKFLKKVKELGSIQTGKLADLAIVAGDTLKNMEFLDRIDLVIKDGKVVWN